ncbi:SDR family NAD(P)-dependent oxidoreductase [Bacillus sp. HMF5848]|uniref:SDR family NAD(P)-dependent oxidoreductase n=1 Tax=Bacillus sp. HMF5848 TaxID=2495421 RepID=UPI000F76F890|nr:SDR family NAD(P)-dependent oxidoreductase [Bacillus sp. HMF5848]RSK25837.1 SDR family NAD(P)-dependent oxidoreductase [Bacillus sp. HMF5848]
MHERERIVIITGANSGIGKAAATQFAQAGHTVIMACRNLKTSKVVQQEIIDTTNNTRVDLMELDVSSFQSINKFCDEFKQNYDKLDILIHNAAYFNHGERHRLSIDELELTFATNVFGPFYMTSLLVDDLKKSDDPRILHAGSNIIKHFFDPKKDINTNSLQGEWKGKRYRVYDMYCQSKMALMLLTFKMAEEYKDAQIKVNALQINGAKMSNETIKKVKPWWRPIARMQNLFFPPTSYMANNYYDICTSENYKNTTGVIFNDKLTIMEPAPNAPGLKQQIQQLFGSRFYPYYGENNEKRQEIWNLCKEVTMRA